VTHHHLAFELSYGFKSNTDKNDDRSTADGYVDREFCQSGDVCEENRVKSYDTEKQCAQKDEFGKNFCDIVRSGTTGTDTGDDTAVLCEVVCHFNRIVLNRCIEVCKEDDQQEVDHCVHRRSVMEPTEEHLTEAVFLEFAFNKHFNGGRQGQNRACEDDRKNTGKVDLQRDIRALAAVHLTADNSLGILNGDSAFCAVHPADENDHAEKRDESDRNDQIVPRTLLISSHDQLIEDRGDTGYDACEQDQGDTVADTLVVDLFTQPHDNGAAGGQCQNNDKTLEDSGKTGVGVACMVSGKHCTGTPDVYEESDTLEKSKTDSDITSDNTHLLAAFFTLFGKIAEGRNSYGEKLNNNGSIDVGSNTQSEQASIVKSITGQHGKVADERTFSTRCKSFGNIDERNGNRTTESEQEENENRIDDLLTQIRDFPCVDNCF